MKQISIADITIYSEDGDTWEDLIQVIKKAGKAYTEGAKQKEKEPLLQKILKAIF